MVFRDVVPNVEYSSSFSKSVHLYVHNNILREVYSKIIIEYFSKSSSENIRYDYGMCQVGIYSASNLLVPTAPLSLLIA